MIAENVNPGNITSSFLNHNLSQFKQEINSFKQNIQYQDREVINTEAFLITTRPIRAEALMGRIDANLFNYYNVGSRTLPSKRIVSSLSVTIKPKLLSIIKS